MAMTPEWERISMCVRHVILLILQTDRVLEGP
jgi:hypothetical protein